MEIEDTEHYGDKNLEEFKNQLLEIADYVNLKANSYEEYFIKVTWYRPNFGNPNFVEC